MMELMVVHPHIFWLSLGGLLLAAEMLGGNGYLLWSGVAAVITGPVVWLVPLGWEWQGNVCHPDAARRGCGGNGCRGGCANKSTAIVI
ncbi:hypothetical protein ECZU38_02480 [Escherichia coli]|nr:hypothetical protein ECZU38_02480 [Escherichia coli]